MEALQSLPTIGLRKTVAFAVLAVAAVVGGHELRQMSGHPLAFNLGIYGCAVLVAIFGLAATRTCAAEVDKAAAARAGRAAAAPLRMTVLLVGYAITFLTVLTLLRVDLNRLLLGGAVTGVVVGIAAQPVLGNFFAGMVLLFARPYQPGDYVRVRSGSLGGPHDGLVETVSLQYTTLMTADGPLRIPNGGMLAAAVGPVPRPAHPAEGTPPAPSSPGSGPPAPSSPGSGPPAPSSPGSGPPAPAAPFAAPPVFPPPASPPSTVAPAAGPGAPTGQPAPPVSQPAPRPAPGGEADPA